MSTRGTPDGSGTLGALGASSSSSTHDTLRTHDTLSTANTAMGAAQLEFPRETKPYLQALIGDWVQREWVRRLDAAFANFLWREVPEAPPLLIFGALLASHQLGLGHACLDLAATLDDPAFTLALPPEGAEPLPAGSLSRYPGQMLEGVALDDWLAALDEPRLVGDGAGSTPLVRVGQRLYLRRCWQYEQDVNTGIARRLERNAVLQGALPAAALRERLDVLFSETQDDIDWQKLACATAARSALTIITGGPGTGKTTTVVKVLAVLQAMALEGSAAAGSNRLPGPSLHDDGVFFQMSDGGHPLRIRLAAPTGKAAARLSESIAGAVSRLSLDGMTHGDAVRAAIPTRVSTLHRLLGSRPGTRKFRHDATNRLALDVLVVDEASMIDLETMAALLEALPPAGRLILLGDKDQLASVEAGAVLADLCARALEGHYTPATAAWLQQVTGQRVDDALVDAHGTALDQAVVMLRHSHRFAAGSGIGMLASAINAGDRRAAAAFWKRGDMQVRKLAGPDCDRGFAALVLHGRVGGAQAVAHDDNRVGYAHYLQVMRDQAPAVDTNPDDLDAWAQAVLQAHGKFQVLTTLRSGDWGVEGLNRRVAELLMEQGLIDDVNGWYAGRPVLVTRNDYALGLMNGDIGMTLALPHGSGDVPALRVAFPMTDGSNRIKWILPSRLQAVETVFALTVHKSQGSEFEHAVVALPENPGPILTRELLYTGITRARTFLTVLSPGGDAVLDVGISRQVRRASGLMA
jgi:exodeoxyribonuclease V alpha subunit